MACWLVGGIARTKREAAALCRDEHAARVLHADCVDRHAERAPFRIALDDGRERYSFADVTEMSRRLATHLRHVEGVAPGDRVVIVLPQRIETAILHVACSRIGAISVPLSPLFGPDGLATRIADARPRLAVTLTEHAPVVADALRLAAIDAPVRLADGALFEAQWTSARVMEASEEARGGPDAPMTLIYTSGTTAASAASEDQDASGDRRRAVAARPKGALLPHRVIPGRMSGFRLAHEPLAEDAVFYSPADWSWIGGLHDSLFAPWHEGVTVLAHERRGHFAPHETAAWLARATDAFLPPTALKALARSGIELPRLRSVHSAGEPLPAPVLAWARRDLAASVTEVYGLTEAAFLIGTATRAYETPDGSMGRPYPDKRVRIVEEEIRVAEGTPTMMLGYWRGPGEAPHLPLDDDRMFRTGDLAREEKGSVYFLGRNDDLIKTSGYRVGPAEIEATLLRHPAVAECAVVGVPDAARGQRVKAFVKRAEPVEADALMAFVKQHLAAHAYPREIEFVDALPMTVSGKLRRRELRER